MSNKEKTPNKFPRREVLPEGTVFTAYGVTTRPVENAKFPDWSEWRYTPKVEVWQACALSLNFDPHSLKERDEYMSESGAAPYFEDRSFPSVAIREEFNKRRRMVLANLPSNPAFSFPSIVAYGFSKVVLAEFAAWARNIGWDIPPELVALAREPVEQAVAPQPPKGAPVTPTKVGAGDTAAEGDTALGQQPHSKGAKWTDDELQNLLRDHNAGKSQEDLASFHGVKRQCISRVLQRANAKFAPKRAADISMVAQAKRMVKFGNDG